MNTAKKTVLVVDDEPKITRQVRLNLELTGEYQVREENDATHALRAARESLPDLIVLDVIMPRIDGGELASRFRADPKFRDIPIVFLTAAITPEEASEPRPGDERYLAKPVDPQQLIQCLHQMLEKPSAQPRPPTVKPDSTPHMAY